MPTMTINEPGRIAVRVAVADGQQLGRDPTCDIVLADRSVSRHHARLVAQADGLHIVDLSSLHGLQIDGVRVTDGLLRDGVRVQLGGVLLEFSARDDPPEQDEEITVYPQTPGGAASAEDARRLAILLELGRAIGAPGELGELAGRVLAATIDAFGCQRGVVELLSSGAASRIARGAAGEIVMSRAVQRALLVQRQPVLVHGKEAAAAPTLVRQGVRAAMAAPLVSAGELLGFVYVDDRDRPDRFTRAELDFLSALAHLLAAAIHQARERGRLERVIEAEHEEPSELVGTSEAMQRLRKEIRRYAAAGDTTVLVLGESGTGKELVARRLHVQSPRAREPYVTVNCAAIPDTMIESELFGHERGAFTGAVKAYRGKFGLADGGTLFLDEVGDLSPGAQAKLLRAVETGEVQPLGSDRVAHVDVRVVSATHRPLDQEVAGGRFRKDLFYRLAVGQIQLPPLRARGHDVVLLAEMFRQRFARALGKAVAGFAPEVLDGLRDYDWPGNVRELRNAIERAVILAEGPFIEDLGVTPAPEAVPAPAEPALAERLEAAERQHIEAALRAHRGNIRATAIAIGVSRGLLYRKIAKYGLKIE